MASPKCDVTISNIRYMDFNLIQHKIFNLPLQVKTNRYILKSDIVDIKKTHNKSHAEESYETINDVNLF